MSEANKTYGQNIIEKIAQRFAVDLETGHIVRSGDYLLIHPAYVMTHDNTGAVIPKFQSIGVDKVAHPQQMVFALDHNVQDKSEANRAKYAKIEQFAKDRNIDFYPAGRGIGHQIMCEEGYVWPGTMVVASDSHSNMYGGLGCLGTPIVRTDAAAIWATGQTWWQVPPVVKVELLGELRPGVTGKDVIITLCGYFNHDEVLNHAVEFYGEGIKSLSLSERLTIANMTTEWGALAGIFPVDEVTLDWLAKRIEYVERRDGAKTHHPRLNYQRLKELEDNIITADDNAYYAKQLTLDLNTVIPYVSGPDHVKVMNPASQMSHIKINKAYLVSCVNSRAEDIAQAAEVVRGKKVAEGMEFYIAAASSEVQKESIARGDWQTLLDAGAIELPPGCGPCIGLGKGLLKDGEIGISATNRNFKGRMGSKKAQAYLASPAVVAASAIAGHIALPFEVDTVKVMGSQKVNPQTIKSKQATKIIKGFPESLEGNIIFCPQDNLNTDGIYPGKYTYIDDFTPQQQAEVVMENYDPEFKQLVKKGNILVGGFNFGTGSSREQAATALKYRGLLLVIAGSFSATYKRNAFNNGFLTIEAPQLVKDLKAKFGADKLTIVTNLHAKISFIKAELDVDSKTYPVNPIGTAAQELIVADGLENWVRKNLEKVK